jgi:nitrite reductase (NADH) small subunit
MPFIRVGALSELPPGSLTEVIVNDNPIALCNVDGRVTALEGVCPHSSGPLGHGALHGCWLVCPWHAWEFDAITGANDRNPDLRAPVYEVRIEGDDIYVNVP